MTTYHLFEVKVWEGMLSSEVIVEFEFGGRTFQSCMSECMVHRIDEEGDWAPWTGEPRPERPAPGAVGYAELGRIHRAHHEELGDAVKFRTWFAHQIDGISPWGTWAEFEKKYKAVELPYR